MRPELVRNASLDETLDQRGRVRKVDAFCAKVGQQKKIEIGIKSEKEKEKKQTFRPSHRGSRRDDWVCKIKEAKGVNHKKKKTTGRKGKGKRQTEKGTWRRSE